MAKSTDPDGAGPLGSKALLDAQESGSDEVTVRLVTRDDYSRLWPLIQAMHQESALRDYPIDLTKVISIGDRAREKPGNFAALMAERSGEPVGFLAGSVNTLFFSSVLVGTVMGWYVPAHLRGSLIGIRLIEGFRRWAIKRGAREIQVHITTGIQMARSDKFLRSLGFIQTGGNYALPLPPPDETAATQD